jgi:hypothetical protein
MKLRSLLSPALAALLAFAAGSVTRADEGMWLYSAPPRDQIKKKYGFDLTDAWLDHVRLSSVRFNSGGSGSFVSGDGLVITNHHVAADDLQKLSDEKHNYLKDGFSATTPAEEKKCVDLELNVLQSIEDITLRVNAAIPTGATGEQAVLARRKITAEIEKESLAKTGLRSDVVTLTGSRNTPTSALSSPPNRASRSSAAIPIISNTPATISMCVSSASTKTAGP